MTRLSVAERAYSSAAVPARDPRQAEYAALGRVSHQLRRAAERRDSDFAGFAAALAQNRRLWTLLAADVADPGNRLDGELRGRIFWLAEFVIAETGRALGGEGDVEALIDVNAAIMQGLRGPGEAA